MKKGFAYLDVYGILHITEGAIDGYNGISTEVEFEGGFPVVDGEKVFMYSKTEAYLGGNRNSFEAGSAKELNFEEHPEILELYIACM